MILEKSREITPERMKRWRGRNLRTFTLTTTTKMTKAVKRGVCVR